MRGLAALAFIVLAVAPARADDLGRHLADGYVTPETASFAAAADGLEAAITTFCADPAGGRGAVDAAFADAVTGWARISFLRFGPLVEANRFERVRFWPDPRGITLRQVQGVLAEEDATAADPATLRDKSVALQGLPALEFALYGSGSEEMAGFRCAYAEAIAATIAETAGEIAGAWAAGGAMRGAFAAPGPDNDLYRTELEVKSEAVKALSTGFQYLRDAELAPVLGDEPSHANARRAPYWRSGLTVPATRAALAGMRDFLDAGIAAELSGADAALAGSIRFEIGRADGVLEEAGGDFAAAVTSPEGYDALSYVLIVLHSLRETVDGPLAAALGTRIGFNALDGD